MKLFKYTLTSILVAILTVIIVQSSQNWTDNVYDGSHVAATDLQNMENNFNALKTNFSGSSAPADAEGTQWWADTSNHILKLRNEADTGWLEVWDLANDRPKGLDAPGEIGGATPANATFEDVEVDTLALQSNTEALSANKTISTGDPQIQFLDPDGSGRDVTLPAEASNDGRIYIVVNTADGDEDLTIKDDGANTISTVGQDEAGIFICDGTSWELTGNVGGAGGAYVGGIIFSDNDEGIEHNYSMSAFATVFTYQIYIPASNPGKIYMKPRIKKGSSGTSQLKFTVNSTDSEICTGSSTSYTWEDEISCDVSGESAGWTTLEVKMKQSDFKTMYLQGYTFRWGE